MSSNFPAHNQFRNNKRNKDSNPVSTKYFSLTKSGDICVFDNTLSSENKKQVTDSITDYAFKAYETALNRIENSVLHLSGYTKARDKCLFLRSPDSSIVLSSR